MAISDKEILDTGSSEKQKKSEEKSKRKRERELNDIRKIVSSAEGRRFIWRLLSKAGIYQQTFTGESNSTSFNEGRRSMGLWVLLDLNEANPTTFTQIQREYLSELNSQEED